jgi:hypothetical protein
MAAQAPKKTRCAADEIRGIQISSCLGPSGLGSEAQNRA